MAYEVDPEDIGYIKGKVEGTDKRLISLDNRINGAFKHIDKHVEAGVGWRRAILVAIVMPLVIIFIQLAGVAYVYGRTSQTIDQLLNVTKRFQVHIENGTLHK